MKKLIGLTILALAFSLNFTAQDANKQSRAEMQAQKMAKELNLTPEQIEKKAAIDEETKVKYTEINRLRQEIMDRRAALPQDATEEQRAAISNEMKALREKQMNIRKEANVKLESILTEEQLAKYKEMRTVKKSMNRVNAKPSK